MPYFSGYNGGEWREGKELYRRHNGSWVKEDPEAFGDGGGLYVYSNGAWRRGWRMTLVLKDSDYGLYSEWTYRYPQGTTIVVWDLDFTPDNFPDIADKVAPGDTIILRSTNPVRARSSSGFGMRIAGWPDGVIIVVDCEVVGAGGSSGGSADITQSNIDNLTPGEDGGDGGSALVLSQIGKQVEISPNAILRGGGGGGGGGGNALALTGYDFNAGEIYAAAALGELGGRVVGDPFQFNDSGGTLILDTISTSSGPGTRGRVVDADGELLARGGYRGPDGGYGEAGADGQAGYVNDDSRASVSDGVPEEHMGDGGKGGAAGHAIVGISSVAKNEGTLQGPTTG